MTIATQLAWWMWISKIELMEKRRKFCLGLNCQFYMQHCLHGPGARGIHHLIQYLHRRIHMGKLGIWSAGDNRQMKHRLIALDHLVITVANIANTIAFYRDILGMQAEKFEPADESTRWALKFGPQKINLHQAGAEYEPKAINPTRGSADLCFLTDGSLDDWKCHLSICGVDIEEGPVARTGAVGPIVSIYIRDPDHNLIEIAVQASK